MRRLYIGGREGAIGYIALRTRTQDAQSIIQGTVLQKGEIAATRGTVESIVLAS